MNNNETVEGRFFNQTCLAHDSYYDFLKFEKKNLFTLTRLSHRPSVNSLSPLFHYVFVVFRYNFLLGEFRKEGLQDETGPFQRFVGCRYKVNAPICQEYKIGSGYQPPDKMATGMCAVDDFF